MATTTEFFKLFHALHTLERVGHCDRETGERLVRAAFGVPEGDDAYVRSKTNLFMAEGLLSLAGHCDDSGRRLAEIVETEMARQGVRFNVEADERDEAGSFKNVEFDSPDDYEKDELGYLTLTVQPGDMSLLWKVFQGYIEDCIGSEDPDNMQERKRVADLHERFTMGGDPQRAIQIDLRDGDVENCFIDGVRQDNVSVAFQDEMAEEGSNGE